MKMSCHLKFATITELRNAPSVPPRGNAVQIRLVTIARRRLGAYSDARAMKHGVAPPSPMPAIKRIASKLS
jgi:hypothetical protein